MSFICRQGKMFFEISCLINLRDGVQNAMHQHQDGAKEGGGEHHLAIETASKEVFRARERVDSAPVQQRTAGQWP